MMFSTSLFAQSNEIKENIEENLTNHLTVLTSKEMNGRKAGTEYSKKAADYIFEQFDKCGLNPERDYFSNGKYQNIIGTIPSKNGKYIIIGAHYDGVGPQFGKFRPAADDNASGIATILELARILVKEDLEYGIKFIAFDGEEIGLLGSNYDSKKINKKDNDYVLMISIDMVGHLRDEGRLIYSGTASFENGEKLIRESKVEDVGIHIKPVWPYAGLATDTVGYDSKGIPTLNIDTGEETSGFHTTDDTMESLDIPGMALITQQICLFIKNVQGKIKPTGVSIYKETEVRYGLSFDKNIGFFAMLPIGSTGAADYYWKINPGISYNLETKDEKIKTTNFNISIPLEMSQKLNGVEFLYGLGPYYTTYLKNYKNFINHELGIELVLEMKANCGIKEIDSFSFGYANYWVIKNFSNDNYNLLNKKNYSYFYLGLYF